MRGIGGVEWPLVLPIAGALLVAIVGSLFLVGVATRRNSGQPEGMPGEAPCAECGAFCSVELCACPRCGSPVA